MNQAEVQDWDGGLTVSEISALLGVSPSTLRSWDRRYGVGASGRAVGQVRFYHAADIDRLRRMVRLIEAGVSAREAARRTESSLDDDSPLLSVNELLDIAMGGPVETRIALERDIQREGLVSAWTRLIAPALDALAADAAGSAPGRSGQINISVALMQVEDSVVTEFVPDPDATRVTVLAWPENLLLGTVIASALYIGRLDVRLQAVPAERVETAIDFLQEHMQIFQPQIVVVLDRLPNTDADMKQLIEDCQANFVLVSSQIPDFVHPRLQRVRTVASGVEEVLATAEQLEAT